MSAKKVDVAVIGAGPAGAAAALEVARAGLSVALFEPRAMPADKPCGEGILPAGVDALRALGLEPARLGGFSFERVRYVLTSGAELEFELPRPALSVLRTDLERALLDALRAEPLVQRTSDRARARRDGADFVVEAGASVWRSSVLIAADGAQGGSAEWLRRGGAGRPRYGARGRATLARALDSVEVHLGRCAEVYLTPLAGGRVNVAVLAGLADAAGGARALLERALGEHPRAAAALAGAPEGVAGCRLDRARPRRVAERGAFLAGDAAAAVDPVLGCGVTLALLGARAAASAAVEVARGVHDGEPERAYARFVARETTLRRLVATGLIDLGARPRLQSVVAALLARAPRVRERLVAAIAGSAEPSGASTRSGSGSAGARRMRRPARPIRG